ncbi:MAG: tetratricopeptide repeat protein [Bacteroidales bacterium]|nr:tetratricopeptide repeat protein [Bacteroidales bacterium]
MKYTILSIICLCMALSAKSDTDSTYIDSYFRANKELIVKDKDVKSEFDSLIGTIISDKQKAYWFYQQGYNFYTHNRYNNALDEFKKAELLYQSIDDKRGTALAKNRLGNTLKLMQQYTEALKYYKEALEINSDIKDNIEIARTQTNMASLYQQFGQYSIAMKYLLNARVAYSEADNSNGMAWIELCMGRLKKEMGIDNDALQAFKRSLDIYSTVKDSLSRVRGNNLCYFEMANMYIKSHKPDSAINIINRLEQLNGKIQDPYIESNIELLKGKAMFAKGKYSNAIKRFNRYIETRKQIGDNDITEALLSKAESLLLLNKVNEADEFAIKAYNLSQKQNNIDAKRKSLYILSALNKLKRQYNKALHYREQYDILSDSLNKKALTKLEMNHMFDRKSKKMEFEKYQREQEYIHNINRQKLYSTITMFALVLVFGIAIFIYVIYRQKRKSNSLLTLRNAEILQQKEEIEAQRDDILDKKTKIEEQNAVITDSIHYASRMQHSVLPSDKSLQRLLKEFFIFFKPRDIVSGDFYWVSEVDESVIFVAADCTGHGVPGAFMSMMGVSMLNEFVNKERITEPGVLLSRMRSRVIESLNNGDDKFGSMDGMNISVVKFNKDFSEMCYAGAFHPILIFSEGETTPVVYKTDRMPVGYMIRRNDIPFKQYTAPIKRGDMIYLFSDGYQDQINVAGRKIMRSGFYNILSEIKDMSIPEQRGIIENKFEKWRAGNKQIDDVMVVGIRI